MFSLMQPGRQRPVEEPRSLAPAPSPTALPTASPGAETRGDPQDDWPKDVHLPDEKEEDEC